jgi:hypothetical protein
VVNYEKEARSAVWYLVFRCENGTEEWGFGTDLAGIGGRLGFGRRERRGGMRVRARECGRIEEAGIGDDTGERKKEGAGERPRGT